ncbi:MAG: hypothetical protein ACTSU5_04245 [Promethearchaeota archaeon]
MQLSGAIAHYLGYFSQVAELARATGLMGEVSSTEWTKKESPFIFNYSMSPLYNFFSTQFSQVDQLAGLFADPFVMDGFFKVQETHQGFAKKLPPDLPMQGIEKFEAEIKKYTDSIGQEVAVLWKELAEKHGLTEVEIFRGAFQMFELLSIEVGILDDFCNTIGIFDPAFSKYSSNFSAILQDALATYNSVVGAGNELSEDPLEKIRVAVENLTVYAILFGYPFFPGYETLAWCPPELIQVFQCESTLLKRELGEYAVNFTEKEVETIVQWYNSHLEYAIAPPQMLPSLAPVEVVFLSNVRNLIEIYGAGTIGAVGQNLQNIHGLPGVQVALYIARYYREPPSEPLPEVEPEFVDPLEAMVDTRAAVEVLPKLPELAPSEAGAGVSVEEMNRRFEEKFEQVFLFTNEDNLRDRPSFSEIDLVLKMLKVADSKTGD